MPDLKEKIKAVFAENGWGLVSADGANMLMLFLLVLFLLNNPVKESLCFYFHLLIYS
jgi:hypothetical protein